MHFNNSFSVLRHKKAVSILTKVAKFVTILVFIRDSIRRGGSLSNSKLKRTKGGR